MVILKEKNENTKKAKLIEEIKKNSETDTYILVVGVDYENKRSIPPSEFKNEKEEKRWREKNPFSNVAEQRKRQIIKDIRKNNQNTELKIFICEFLTGEILLYTRNTNRPTKKFNLYRNIKKDDYWPGTHKFKNGIRDVMSVTDVYDLICEIGKNAPGTLKELSIFSHAWMGGPIFVNSYDDRSSIYTGEPMTVYELLRKYPDMINLLNNQYQRDPDDKDARIIDFHPNIIEPEYFKKAFHEDGFSWIWGCHLLGFIFKNLINMIMRSRIKSDSDTFTVYNTKDINFVNLFEYYKIGKIQQNRKAVTATFDEIKRLFCKALRDTYAFNLARYSKKRVYASPLGAGVIFEKENDRLMKVNPDAKKVVNFYKKHLKLNTDPTGRNYIEYPPYLTCDKNIEKPR